MLRRSIPLLTAALVFGIGLPARAEIPYADQITPGELRGIARDFGDAWVLGYWEYLPANFDELGDGELLPLVVFLPGIGEYDSDSACPGDVDWCTWQECNNGDGLCRALSWGPQLLIRTNAWDDTARPFIMVSPQSPVNTFSQQEWDLDDLDAFFEFVVANYPVDPRRMYLTGMSQGGRATMQYVAAHPRRFTAAVPAPGGQVYFPASCEFADTAFWVFHGEDDQDGNLGPGVFNPCAQVEMLYMYNNPDAYPGEPECVTAVGEPRPVGRMTMYDNVAHSSWIQTIDPIGSGFPASEWSSDQGCGFDVEFREYNAANDPDGIYSWFLGLDRPDVVAPDDVDVEPTQAQLTAVVTDDDAVMWTWTQTGGPEATLTNADQATVDLDDLQPLTDYTFEVLVVDVDGQWDRDEVTIHVGEAPAGSSSDGGTSETSGDTAGTTAGTGAEGTGAADTGDTGGTGGSSGGATAADSSGGATASATASATAGSATGATGASDDGSSGTSTGGEGGGEDDGGGCGCAAERRGAASAWLLAAFGLLGHGRRRGSRRP